MFTAEKSRDGAQAVVFIASLLAVLVAALMLTADSGLTAVVVLLLGFGLIIGPAAFVAIGYMSRDRHAPLR